MSYVGAGSYRWPTGLRSRSSTEPGTAAARESARGRILIPTRRWWRSWAMERTWSGIPPARWRRCLPPRWRRRRCCRSRCASRPHSNSSLTRLLARRWHAKPRRTSDALAMTPTGCCGFGAIFGRSVTLPDQLPPPLAQGVRAVRAVRRRPWEVELPVAELASTSFPKLVISGDHNPVFEAICDSLAAGLHAERAHVAGAGHATPDTGDLFNPGARAIHQDRAGASRTRRSVIATSSIKATLWSKGASRWSCVGC